VEGKCVSWKNLQVLLQFSLWHFRVTTPATSAYILAAWQQGVILGFATGLSYRQATF